MRSLYIQPIKSCWVGMIAVAALTSFGPVLSRSMGQDGVALYQQRLEEWKDIIIELYLLRQEYSLAPTFDESNRIREKYEQTKEAGNRKIRELKIAAAQAYREKPRTTAEYHEFLVNSLAFDMEQTEDQEIAYIMAQALASQPITRTDVARRVGMSFFLHNEFEKAEKLLKSAQSGNDESANVLQHYVDLIPRMKKIWEDEVKKRARDKETGLPRAIVETTRGRFVIELFENDAPNTVANFVKLAQSGFYDDLDFFTVIPYQFAVTGSPSNDLQGSPGYVLKNEAIDPAKRRGNFRGSVCVPALNEGAEIAGSIFMITFAPYSEANTPKYCNFGRVIEGIEVVDSLTRSMTPDNQPIEDYKPDKIKSIKIENLKDHPYEPEVIRQSQ